jgi:hypothetical protein
MNWVPAEVPDLSAPHDHDQRSEKASKRCAEVIPLR